MRLGSVNATKSEPVTPRRTPQEATRSTATAVACCWKTARIRTPLTATERRLRGHRRGRRRGRRTRAARPSLGDDLAGRTQMNRRGTTAGCCCGARTARHARRGRSRGRGARGSRKGHPERRPAPARTGFSDGCFQSRHHSHTFPCASRVRTDLARSSRLVRGDDPHHNGGRGKRRRALMCAGWTAITAGAFHWRTTESFEYYSLVRRTVILRR